jgi:hypothetical protein
MWAGGTVAILASGESMTAEVAQTVRAAGVFTIAVNNTWEMAFWADLLFAGDAPWWEMHHKKLGGFSGIKVCAEETPFPDVRFVRPTGKVGFDPDPSCIRTGGNSGYGAMHVAAHAGAARLLLFGFDMQGGHWHDPHPWPLYQGDGGHFPRWIARFKVLAAELAALGIEVLNCTPGSALDAFPMARMEDALAA